MTREIGVGLIGLGVAGGGGARALIERRDYFARQVGAPLIVRRAAVRDASKLRTVDLPPGVLTTNVASVLEDPSMDIVVDLSHAIVLGNHERKYWGPEGDIPVLGLESLETRYYIRVRVTDEPGVLAQIARTLGDYRVSIAAVNQKEADADEKTAELVIMTHRAREGAMQAALREIEGLPVVAQVSAFLRVEA